MIAALLRLFSSEGYMPHGMCLLWEPGLIDLHVWSDALIGLSYYSMPIALIYFARKRPDVALGWILILFGIFILACGTTHFFSIWTLWHPDYVLDGTIKAVTAAASIPTAIILWMIMPQALAMPNTRQLQTLNSQLRQEVTERERSEAALSEVNRQLTLTTAKLERSEREAQALSDRLALGTEAGGIGVWDYNIASNSLWRDDRIHELFDMPRGDVDTGYKVWLDRLHPADQKECDTAFKHSIATGAPYVGEFRVLLSTGATRTIRSNGKVFRDSNGHPMRMAGISYDVTDLRERELDTARRALDRFQRVVEATPDAMVLINAGGAIEMVNTQTEHVFGYERAELLGKSVEMLLPDRFKAHHPALRQSFFAEPESRPMGAGRELFGRRKDGSEFPVEIGLNPIETDEGPMVLSAIINITERQRATEELQRRAVALDVEVTQRRNVEAALRKSSEDFRYLFHNNPLPMWVYDCASLAFLEVNESAILNYGFSRDEFMSMSIMDIRPPEDIDLVKKNLATETSVYQVSSNWRHRRKNGDIIRADIFSHALSFEGKEARLIVALDVTQRNAAEEQLRQAQKMEAIGQLTGGVAHDFNNLLAIIQGNLELMASRLADPDMSEMAGDALRATERGAKLTQQLLAYSRQQPLVPHVVTLNDVLTDLLALLSRTLEETIQMDSTIAPDLWKVRIDRNQLENALLNLAINARDSMPRGGRLTLEASNTVLDTHYAEQNPDVRSGAYVMIAVTDTGSGMSPETIGRAFEPFFTTKSMGRGTGLGLSMVYGFVKQSGGHIKIYSELGHGTSVKLYLPRLQIAETETSITESESTVQGSIGDEVILVVEDDAAVRKLAVRLLRGLGYVTIEAEDGPAALIALNDAPQVDLLFTDVVMPRGMNGRDLAREAQARRPQLKVLYMSGYTKNAILHNGELDEGVHLLSKPFHLAELALKVRMALEDKAAE